MSTTAGYATLQVIPSVRGIADDLRRQLVAPAAAAGSDAGDAAGSGFGSGFKGAIAALGLAAVAAKVGGAFAAALGDAIGQSNVTSNLQAQLGTSNNVAAQQGKLAGKLYASGVADSFGDAAEAIKSVVQSGLAPPGTTNAQLQQIATKASDVATVFGQDLGGVTNAVAQLMRTGLVKNSGEAFDLITKGFQGGADKAGDLLDTMNEYGTQFRKLGLDGTTAMGLIQQAIQGGARDSDLAADAIKEFSIRAIDGSANTIAGFKALGLSATTMATNFGKGGSVAAGALDLTLDRLRSIKDPIKQASVASYLFGTQAEDLGAALFKMDPSSASKGLGTFAGAADKLGTTIRSGPAYEIGLFKRTLQQGFVDFLGGKVLPILGEWGGVLDTKVLPPLVSVGGVLSDAFLPTLAAIGAGLSATVGWFKQWGIWLAPLAILIGGVTLALSAEAIATGLVTGIFSLYSAAISIGTVVTEGFAGAQALLNAVMAINPFVLIAIALAALVALVVIAWKNSETFRSIVLATWAAIQVGALYLWHTVLEPIFSALVVGFQAIGRWATWLWTNAIGPAFAFIWTAAKILATILAVIMFGPLYLGFKILGAVAMWLWTNAISPMIDFILIGFNLWWAGVQLYFGLVMTGFRAVGAAAMWLWTNAISPVIGWIVGGFNLWWTGVQLYFGLVMSGFRAVGSAATWLWTNAISPALHNIVSGAQWLYDKGLKPPIDKVIALAKAIGGAFTTGVGIVGDQFGKLGDLAKKPVSFIIDTVYNKGLRGVWNGIADAFGAPELPYFKGFAAGGAVHGPGTETSDSVLSRLSRNEHVWTAREVRGAGGHGRVMALRQMAAQGRLGLPGFKDGGGLFGWIGSAASAVKGAGSKAWDLAKSGASWIEDTIAGSARAGVNAIVRPLLAHIPGLGSGFGKMIAALPNKMIDALFGYADKADEKGASATSSAAGGGQLGAWIAKAMGLTHVPASWAGPLRTLIMRESGGNPSAINLTDSNAAMGYPSQGLMQTIPQTFAAYALPGLGGITDPIANIVAGIRYILSRYGSIFNVQQAVGATPKGYASGTSGALPGWAWVGERGPELMRLRGGESILNHSQSVAAVAAQAAAARAAGSAMSTMDRTTAGGQAPVTVYYQAPTPEEPEKVAMEIGRRVNRAVSV